MIPVQVNQQRLIKQFVTLAEISSPSRQERPLADYLIQRLRQLGLEVEEDDAASRVNGNCGNLLAVLPGERRLPALFFCCHLDTVQPGVGVEVELRDGIFRSRGETVLGGDDKAGIAILLELLELLRESGLPHGRLEFVFTICEEQGLLGSRYFDTARLEAGFGYVLDTGVAPGTIVLAAPAQNVLNLTIRGRSAHAGIDPEQGVNAIQVAGKALAGLKLGRVDRVTTANIGVISGGKATNIIPDAVYLAGEVRSLERDKLQRLTAEIRRCFEEVSVREGAGCQMNVRQMYAEYRHDCELPAVKLAAEAARIAGFPPRLIATGGGSDANIFNSRGLTAVNLSIGMDRVHTVDEVLEVANLTGSARWLWQLLQLAMKGSDAR